MTVTDLVTASTFEDEAELYADALLKHGSLEKAARALSMTPSHAKRLGQSKAVARLVKTKAQAEIATVVVARATQTLMECMAPGMPPSTRLKAAGMAFALAGLAGGDDTERSIDELTADELATFIKQADSLLGRKALAAMPIGKGSAA